MSEDSKTSKSRTVDEVCKLKLFILYGAIVLFLWRLNETHLNLEGLTERSCWIHHFENSSRSFYNWFESSTELVGR